MDLPDSCKYAVTTLCTSYFLGRVIAEENHVTEFLELVRWSFFDVFINKRILVTYAFLATCEFAVYLYQLQKPFYPAAALAGQWLMILFAHGAAWLAYFHNPYMNFTTAFQITLLGMFIPMKLISFIKHEQKLVDKKLPPTPAMHVLRILLTPWLVFRDYGFIQRPIRKRFIVQCIFEYSLATALMIHVTLRWIVPVVRQQVANKHEILIALLRINGTLFFWIWPMFYQCFHCTCAVFFEITRCANAKAFEDWWNSMAIFDFWRMWNLPVHYFLLDNVFGELVAHTGLSKRQASIATFLISGVLHDYALSMAFGSFKSASFTAFFIMQLVISPLFQLTKTISPVASKVTLSALVGTSISGMIYCYA